MTVKVSNRGASPATISTANAGPLTEVLNGPNRWFFEVPNDDVDPAVLKPLEREGELWDGATLKFAGPIVDISMTPNGMTRYQCEGLEWYLAGRQIARFGSGRENLGTPFDGSLTGYTSNATTATAQTSPRIKGDYSARLVTGSAGADSRLTDTISITATSVGTLVTVVAYFNIDTFTNPAAYNLGLYVTHDGTGPATSGFTRIDSRVGAITDTWQYAKVTVWIPPNETVTLTVSMYGPHGTIFWSEPFIVLMESLSYYATEQATIGAGIVGLVQDTDYGWDDLGITTSTTATGIVRDRHWQFVDEVSALTALRQLSGLDDGYDWEITPARVWQNFNTRRGADLTGSVTLTLNSNCVLTGYRFDGYSAATGVGATGQGSGPEREEGYATDTSLYGGLRIQQLFAPAGDPPIDALEGLAARRLETVLQPKIVPVRVTDPSLAASLELGDIVDTNLVHGPCDETGDMRIVARTELVDSDDALLELVPA